MIILAVVNSGQCFLQTLNALVLGLINSKISESATLAKHVQFSVNKVLKDTYPEIADLGIGQAPIEILLGSHIPSIAIFIGNISNDGDCKMLSSEIFWEKLSEGIVKGIIEFVNDNSL